MPCSDRGIGIVKKGAMHSIAIDHQTNHNGYRKQKPALGGGWVGDIESRRNEAGINGLSARMSILPPLSGCSCSRVGHFSTQEQERPDSRPQKQWGLSVPTYFIVKQSGSKPFVSFLAGVEGDTPCLNQQDPGVSCGFLLYSPVVWHKSSFRRFFLHLCRKP